MSGSRASSPRAAEPTRTGSASGRPGDWDRVAAAYATSPIHAAGPDLEWLVEALDPPAGARILDLGCGAGHAGFAAAARGATVVAVDTSEGMLETARLLADERELAGYVAINADVTALPFADGAFDGAVSRYSAHHWPDVAAACREAARVVRPGGRIVIIDTVAPDAPAMDTLVNALELLRDPSHGRNLRLDEWRSTFVAAGWEVLHERRWPIVLETVSWFARAQTEPWRAEAARALLRVAPPEAVAQLDIEGDARWNVPAALICGHRPT